MSSALAQYESFLLNNGSTISTVESSLRSLTWFLPGRFKDAELASEACSCCLLQYLGRSRFNDMSCAVSAFLNLTSLYHDTLLNRIMHSDPKFKPLIPPSTHSRYTRSWAEKSSIYKWAARVLEVIRFTELVVEMGLRRKTTRKNRWRGVVILEAIKCVATDLQSAIV